MQTLDQKRAAFAWECAQVGMEQFQKEYKPLAKGAPALIMNSGLMPTMAFYMDKSKAAKLMTDDVIRWLSERLYGRKLNRDQGIAVFTQFMQALQSGDSQTYLRATDEALEILKWIRQFVGAVPQGGNGNG